MEKESTEDKIERTHVSSSHEDGAIAEGNMKNKTRKRAPVTIERKML